MESARFRLLKHRFLAGFHKMTSPLIDVVRNIVPGFPLIFHEVGD
jgi:hypothetical protein